jgi:hypothetical protein
LLKDSGNRQLVTESLFPDGYARSLEPDGTDALTEFDWGAFEALFKQGAGLDEEPIKYFELEGSAPYVPFLEADGSLEELLALLRSV